MFKNASKVCIAILAISFYLPACGSSDSSSVNDSPVGLGGLPTISDVKGIVTEGGTLTISGVNFSEKIDAKPLFWWRADDGATPSLLGRKEAWDDVFRGTQVVSPAPVAPGSTQSIEWDHALSSQPALSRVDFTSDELYIHRKLYESFDIVEDVAIRSWVLTSSISGPLNVGDIITGNNSVASGTVIQTNLSCCGQTTIHYSNEIGSGTVADSLPVNFENGEIMTTDFGTTMTNDEPGPNGVGVYRTFNHKIIRMWYLDPPLFLKAHSITIEAQGSESNNYRVSGPAGSPSTSINQNPNEWLTQEFEYRASSSPNVADGRFNFFENGVVGADQPTITRTDAYPDKFFQLFQSQVSDGAQPGSNIYYDSLYVDDSWHRVIICSGATPDLCNDREVQIPSKWSDSSVTVQQNLGGLDPNTIPLYLYVLDKNGLPNKEGWPLNTEVVRPNSPTNVFVTD